MRKVVVAFDPGKKNFAYSILSKKGKLLDFNLLGNEVSQKEGLISNLKEGEILVKQYKKFVSDLRKILKIIKKNDAHFILIYERFIPRGLTKGNLSEIVSMLIGMLILTMNIRRCRKVVPVTAATWKVHRNKFELLIDNDTLSVHVSDAIGMALHYLLKQDYLTLKKVKSIVKKINTTNFKEKP